MVVRLPSLSPGRGHLICGILVSTAPSSEQSSVPAVHAQISAAASSVVHTAVIRLPDPPGGLRSLLDAGLPTGYQQLPSTEHVAPCSQIWRIRQPQRSGSSGAPHAGMCAAASSNAAGQSVPWATFSWASERGSAPHSNRISTAPASAGQLSVSNLNSAGPPAKRPRSAASAGDSRSGPFAAAWSGETAEWVAAHGGVWAVRTSRQLIRCHNSVSALGILAPA